MAFYNFIRDKLAYRLHDATEERSMLLERALELLPITEQLEGRGLFKKFLIAWDTLRRQFTTFVICHREVDAAGEIPLLTDQFGKRPTFVSDIVELGDSEERENFTARMLEKRLLKQTDDILINKLSLIFDQMLQLILRSI
jgi:hypothetical protein